MFSSITYTEARERFAPLWDDVLSTRDPVEITRRGHESLVILPASELAGLMETAHLLRSPKNAARLLESLARTRAGEGKVISLTQLQKEVGNATRS
ncbi:MAG: type II toxin-antitoxin system Phd/YefM family antitoxin [Puniceicoccales bacterium]|jgi:antitoxin YefM|nr:type II toxin-antitoxin system Phd/YefM family antitoxin [Puniceicoccales bacterium]